MTEQEFLAQLGQSPESIDFKTSIAVIEENYAFTPIAFKVGHQENKLGENQGSCKLLAYAQRQNLDAQLALHLFGAFYRKDVLENPEGTDHQNIRNFIEFGWEGVAFEGESLSAA